MEVEVSFFVIQEHPAKAVICNNPWDLYIMSYNTSAIISILNRLKRKYKSDLVWKKEPDLLLT